MNARLEYLRRRREYLVSQAAVQRSEVAYSVAQLQKPLRLLDMGFAVVKAARIHPLLAMTSMAMFMRAPRNKLLFWGSRLFTAWELFAVVRKQWPKRSP